MNCPNCNAVLGGTTKFCTKCGFKIMVNPQPQPQMQPQWQPQPQPQPQMQPQWQPQPQPQMQPQQAANGFCTVCGASLNPNMKFCTKCGAAAGASAPSLLRVSNNEKIKIEGQEFLIGKKREAVSYCIADNPAVSRVHAKIINKGGQYFVVDMGSTNHTYVDGTQAPANIEVPLRNGAKIRISNEEFIFKP